MVECESRSLIASKLSVKRDGGSIRLDLSQQKFQILAYALDKNYLIPSIFCWELLRVTHYCSFSLKYTLQYQIHISNYGSVYQTFIENCSSLVTYNLLFWSKSRIIVVKKKMIGISISILQVKA